MDTRSAFGVILVLLGLGGLYALVTRRLTIANGQIVIGAPAPATTGTTSNAGAGQPDAANSTFGTYGTGSSSSSSPTMSGVPNAQQILATILGNSAGQESAGGYYPASQPAALVTSVAGDGLAVNPFGATA